MKQITNENRVQSHNLGLLVHGLPGSGKTWLCASAALCEQTSPMVYCDYMGQSESLATFKALEDTRFVHLEMTSYDDLSLVYSWLANPAGRHADLDALVTTPPLTVAIDSLTEIHRMEVLRYGGFRISSKLPTDVGWPEIQHWGKLLNQFMVLGWYFYIRLHLNVIFTCLSIQEMDDKERVTRIKPAMQGSSSELFPSRAMSVMYLERAPDNAKDTQGNHVYNVGYFNHPKAFCRDNTGKFPDVIPNPTVGKLMDYLRK